MYRQLGRSLVDNQYKSVQIGDYPRLTPSEDEPHVFLRHDVDRAPRTALALAAIESSLGLTATYFFRCVSSAFDPDVITKVRDLGMEVGYHYECLDRAHGDYEKAYVIAREDLKRLREIAPVKSMAMHGNPWTSHDNRDLWKEYDYRELGIEVAAYLTIDYSKVRYFTDTGRNWDESRGNLYDMVADASGTRLTSTPSLIEYLARYRQDCCISTHPHRWTNNPVSWSYNAVYDYAGNVVKTIIRSFRHGNKG